MKINSKMAKMLNPYTNTFSFINKTYKHRNYNYSATIIYLCSILAGESVIKIPKGGKKKLNLSTTIFRKYSVMLIEHLLHINECVTSCAFHLKGKNPQLLNFQ